MKRVVVVRTGLLFVLLRAKKSMFTSYRSNRFNCLFQNATAFLYHRQDIVEFLTDFNCHDNKKLQSVLEDTTDKRILANIAVLSFLHVFLTEPYWQLMTSSKTYAEFPQYVVKLQSFLSKWGQNNNDDHNVLPHSVFDDFPCDDLFESIVSTFLQSSDCHMAILTETLRRVCE